MIDSEQKLTVDSNGKAVSLTFTRSSLSVVYTVNTKNDTNIVLRQVLGACVTESSLEVSFVARKKEKGRLSLVKVVGTVKEEETTAAKEWAEALMNLVYLGIKRCRRVKVILNPFAGNRRAVSIFANKVQPVLLAAQCSLDTIHTTHSRHAYEIAKELDLEVDVIAPMSGDGTIHEILNGLAEHQHPIKALRIPIAPIPTGSGNGLSLNVLGYDDAADPVAAALNVVKGQPMKIDLFSITQKDKRVFSFMSQALGLMADLDLGTEHLRWMGPVRFTVGLLYGILTFKPCPVQLSMKLPQKDKLKMAEDLQSRHERIDNGINSPVREDSEEEILPMPQFTDDQEGWVTFDKPLLYLYAGKGPYVGKDLMAFPVSLPDDGMIDIVAQELSSRSEVINAMGEAPKGGHYWSDTYNYFKASAYRVKPLAPKGYLSVDGEAMPFEEFHVEVHRGLATLLSSYGYYATEFAIPSHRKQDKT